MRLCFSRQVLKNPSVRVAHFAFEITLSGAITLTLLLVCAFSPKVQKYLLGSPFLTNFRVLSKRQISLNFPVFFMTFVFYDIQNYGYRRHDYRKQAKFDNGIDCNHA